MATRYSFANGLTVGRTIVTDAARRFLAGEIRPEAAVADVATRYRALSGAWNEAMAKAGRRSA